MGSAPASRPEDRRFWYALALASVLHALLFLGAGKSPHRQMGEPEGSLEGVSVELMDEADFLSRATVPAQAAPPGAPAAPSAPPAPAEAALQSPPAEAAAERPAKPAPRQREEVTASAIQEANPELFSLPDPAPKQREDASRTPPNHNSAPPHPAAPRPRLTMPDIPMPAAGRSAAVGRPPGITRSGENDEFGRGVVRALRQTMPPPRGQTGRVTVRLLVSLNGNLDEVQVVRSSGDPTLDQSVVFATKQSSFPFPPRGATVSDRTFMVTYIYN